MPLPFDLPALSRGYAALGRGARAVGADSAAAAARSLSALLAREVAVDARAVPGVSQRRASAARVGIHLAALPARAVLEVEPALVVRLVDVFAGGPGDDAAAAALTPVEASALELFALAALDGVCAVPGVEEALGPWLEDDAGEVPGALAVELRVSAGDVSGRARLLLPPAAVRAFEGVAPSGGPAVEARLGASLRSGSAALSADELAALAPGDVVLVDPAPGGVEDLVLPGGHRLRGRREGDTFRVEETTMAETHAQLPITLEVELARIEIAIGELARLEPGGVLMLPVDRRGLVTLRAGERAVARGELVDVDGAVGVRILAIEVGP
jgi:type III secretion protein Q